MSNNNSNENDEKNQIEKKNTSNLRRFFKFNLLIFDEKQMFEIF